MDTATLRRLAPHALAAVTLPGRVEILGTRPWLVVDGAHTAESAQALTRTLRSLPASERVLLLSLSGEKPALPTLAPLLACATRLVVTRAEPLRSRDPRAVADEIRTRLPALPLACIDEPEAALAEALALTPADGLLCAAGSVYVAGFARRPLREAAARRAAA